MFVFLYFTDSTKIETSPSHDKNNPLSDESDEEEWNYFKGEEKANSETNNLEKSSCSEVSFAVKLLSLCLGPGLDSVSFSFRKLDNSLGGTFYLPIFHCKRRKSSHVTIFSYVFLTFYCYFFSFFLHKKKRNISCGLGSV